MKKLPTLCLLMLLLSVLPAAAQSDFAIDEMYIFTGMERSYLQGYIPSVQNHVMAFCAPVVSPRAEGRIIAALRMEDESVSPLKAGENTATFQKGNDGVYRVRLEVPLYRQRQNGDYPAVLSLRGADAAGRDMTAEIPFILRIRDGQANADGGEIELNDIAAELRVGEDGLLRAKIKNTSKSKEMRGISLSFSDARGDILPLGMMPVKLGALAPGGETSISIPLSVRGDAAVALHTLDFAIRYDALGARQEIHASCTLPVTQEMNLKQGGLQMPASIIQGDLLSLSLPLMNMGRGDVHNVLATLSLTNVTQGQSVLVGTIAPGDTRQANMTVLTGKQALGEVSGELLIQYEDAFGNAASFSLPVALTIEEPPVRRTAAVSEATEEKDEPPLLLYLLAGGCGALLLTLILQGVLLRRKIHRMEEEKL